MSFSFFCQHGLKCFGTGESEISESQFPFSAVSIASSISSGFWNCAVDCNSTISFTFSLLSCKVFMVCCKTGSVGELS